MLLHWASAPRCLTCWTATWPSYLYMTLLLVVSCSHSLPLTFSSLSSLPRIPPSSLTSFHHHIFHHHFHPLPHSHPNIIRVKGDSPSILSYIIRRLFIETSFRIFHQYRRAGHWMHFPLPCKWVRISSGCLLRWLEDSEIPTLHPTENYNRYTVILIN